MTINFSLETVVLHTMQSMHYLSKE